MNSEELLEMMQRPEYMTMSCGEFARIIKMARVKDDKPNDAIAEDEKYAKQVERANDILNRDLTKEEVEWTNAFWDKIAEDEKYAKQVARAREIPMEIEENDRIQERKEEEEHYADYGDQVEGEQDGTA